jgi:hypothetical protein
MIRASALYLAIIMALVIAVLCSALLVAAYYYRINYQGKFKVDRMQLNLLSAVDLAKADTLATGKEWTTIALYDAPADSVRYKRYDWGVYDIGIAEAFDNRDTMRYIFSLGRSVDSLKKTALYISDEDRPVSLSGHTFIRGDAYLPKAGIHEAFVDNEAYSGDKSLITSGIKKKSDKALPPLNRQRIALLEKYFNGGFPNDSLFFKGDSVFNSFRQPTRYLNLGKNAAVLRGRYFGGNIIIVSDTTLTIDSTTKLDNIIIAARSIIVSPGFSGSCQLFATDSVSIGARSRLKYPSAIGAFRLANGRPVSLWVPPAG